MVRLIEDVSQKLHDVARMNPLREQQRGRAVAQVVQIRVQIRGGTLKHNFLSQRL